MEMCGGDAVKDWEGIGKAICIPESKLEDISLTHKEDVEKCKEQLFKVSILSTYSCSYNKRQCLTVGAFLRFG